MIRFQKFQETAILHNPLKGFELEAQPIEYRIDPISGLTSTFHTRMSPSPVIFKPGQPVNKYLRDS